MMANLNFDTHEDDYNQYATEQLPDLTNFYHDYAKAIADVHYNNKNDTSMHDINKIIHRLASAGNDEAMLILNEM